MIQLARQQLVTAAMARQEHHLTTRNFAGEKVVGRRAERRFDLHPFLVGKAFDVIEPRAADDADPMF